MSPSWRVIHTGTHSASENMAIDHLLLDGCRKGVTPNTLRFYRWFPSAVSIGRFQRLQDEVDVEACALQGIEIVRRISSGGAVYHDFEGELTYSLICQTDETNIPRGVVASYQHLCHGIIEGLRLLGVQAEFSSGSERACPNLFVKGRKISGNAQSRSGRAMLQHGTILRKLDLDLMFSVLRVEKTKADCLVLEHAATRLTSLQQELGTTPSFVKIEEALLSGFMKVLRVDFTETELNPTEWHTVHQIAKNKYSNPQWTCMR